MPGSMLVDFIGDFIFRPLLEGAWHLTGRGVLRCVFKERLVIVPDEPETPPRNWKNRQKWEQRQRAIAELPRHLRPIRVLFSLVTLVGVLVWMLIIGLAVLLVWLL